MYNFPLSHGVDITARVHAIVVMTRKSRFLEQRDERKVRASLTTLSEGLQRNAIAEQSRDKCYTHAMRCCSSIRFFLGFVIFLEFLALSPLISSNNSAIASVIIIPLIYDNNNNSYRIVANADDESKNDIIICNIANYSFENNRPRAYFNYAKRSRNASI